MTTFNFKSKEEYLKWRAEWKAEYKETSREIRRLKNARKQFSWKYRPKGNDTMKRRTKIGPNPNYDPSVGWEVWTEKCKATSALDLLKIAKVEAGKQRAKRLAEEEAA